MDSSWHQQIIARVKQIVSRFKPYLRWLILGATLFFVVSTLRQHWNEVTALRLNATGYATLTVALGVTLFAHIWSGWVWSWILRELNQPAQATWGILVYLQTNIAKYLPGNVWHFYGRVVAAKTAGFPVDVATLSVVLEPLLMASAALAIALSGQQTEHWLIQVLSLTVVLAGIHPTLLNPLLKIASRLKGKSSDKAIDRQTLRIKRYPLRPLLGELIFVGLRGTGFLLALLALHPIAPEQISGVFSAFGFAWLLGLVIPGAPGGIGVFEATAIALLDDQLSPALILGGVALYRLISTLAEAAGAGLAWLDEKF
ncbi:MAG: UPF0104 family protein [Cyanobacteria bacterium CRU_2_1]|nr:UPF0104 family protein [Cyanobacteria bacterium CRU_2_1]